MILLRPFLGRHSLIDTPVQPGDGVDRRSLEGLVGQLQEAHRSLLPPLLSVAEKMAREGAGACKIISGRASYNRGGESPTLGGHNSDDGKTDVLPLFTMLCSQAPVIRLLIYPSRCYVAHNVSGRLDLAIIRSGFCSIISGIYCARNFTSLVCVKKFE